jgi:hypothetical protein
MADINRKTDLNTGTTGLGADDWVTEEIWWRESFTNRPYVRADLGFDYYSPGYRYGFESATKYRGRQWKDVEPELERGWDKFRGTARSTWQDIKEAVKDAWDHVTGDEHERHRRTTGATARVDQRF